ncbi:MAG: hypothetical protein ACR2HH_14565 [Chthoniobacterales bacterium]
MKLQRKHLCLVPLMACFVYTSSAADVEKLYYIGEAKLSSPSGQPRDSQAFLLEKVHDPNNQTIVERAIVVKADHTVEEHTITMKVKGDTFTISDAGDTVHGSGKLFGPAWHWSYFKGTYESSNGVRIEDENYMTDPSVLVARKKISAPDGTALMYMDITLKTVTLPTFTILSESLKARAPTPTEKKP